jgi:hypothetical protein
MSIMDRRNNYKLQTLLQCWPSGVVATTKWLERFDISRQLASAYKKGGWIVSFGQASFFKSQDKIEWYGGLHALQFQLNLNVHVGGKTALELQGLAHYIPMGQQNIDLLVTPSTRIPRWFTRHLWRERIRITENNALPSKIEIQDVSMGNFNIQVSSRERAVLELLCLTPRLYSFEETQIIMGSVGTLRSDVLTKLLSICTSEKTKRLLLYFGDQQNYAWRSKINEKKCKIGKTLLKIASQNGKYHSKYNLFLPREYVIQNDKDVKF